MNIRSPEGEWMGVNDVVLLEDGKLFVLGHRAYWDENKIRHY